MLGLHNDVISTPRPNMESFTGIMSRRNKKSFSQKAAWATLPVPLTQRQLIKRRLEKSTGRKIWTNIWRMHSALQNGRDNYWAAHSYTTQSWNYENILCATPVANDWHRRPSRQRRMFFTHHLLLKSLYAHRAFMLTFRCDCS